MATDTSLDEPLVDMRQRMEKIRDAIKQANEKATALEKEKEDANQMLRKTIGKQQEIKAKIDIMECDILITEMRVKEMEECLFEKEELVKKAVEIQEKEQQIDMYTDTYNETYERYQETKTKKIDLEQKFKITENRSQDIEDRINASKLELEYNLGEEGKRSKGCKDSIDAVFQTEQSCFDLQRGLDIVMKREEVATKKVNDLESQINRLEDTFEGTNFERCRVEAMIREVLLSVKAHYSS